MREATRASDHKPDCSEFKPTIEMSTAHLNAQSHLHLHQSPSDDDDQLANSREIQPRLGVASDDA